MIKSQKGKQGRFLLDSSSLFILAIAVFLTIGGFFLLYSFKAASIQNSIVVKDATSENKQLLHSLLQIPLHIKTDQGATTLDTQAALSLILSSSKTANTLLFTSVQHEMMNVFLLLLYQNKYEYHLQIENGIESFSLGPSSLPYKQVASIILQDGNGNSFTVTLMKSNEQLSNPPELVSSLLSQVPAEGSLLGPDHAWWWYEESWWNSCTHKPVWDVQRKKMACTTQDGKKIKTLEQLKEAWNHAE